jgi:hypothetical protein
MTTRQDRSVPKRQSLKAVDKEREKKREEVMEDVEGRSRRQLLQMAEGMELKEFDFSTVKPDSFVLILGYVSCVQSCSSRCPGTRS